MRRHMQTIVGAQRRLRLALFGAFVACAALGPITAEAAKAPAAATSAPATATAADDAMNSPGMLPQVFMQLEDEATSDVGMLPDTPGAIEREWQTFDKNGSSLGALINVGWVALLTALAVLAERVTARGLTRRLRKRLRQRPEGPSVSDLLRLALCDAAGLAVFVGVYTHGRHWLGTAGVAIALIVFASNVIIRWRIAAVIVHVLLRPNDRSARLIDSSDREARRLAWFLSSSILATIVLIGFARYGLMDEDSGAPHVVALVASAAVNGLFALMVVRARVAFEGLIRGHTGGIAGALRAAIARAWVAIGLTLAAGNFLFFIFGLSLGLLDYYHGALTTIGLWLVLLVFERLTELGWTNSEAALAATSSQADRLVRHSLRRILLSAVVLIAAVLLAVIWTHAMRLHSGLASRTLRATLAATSTLFIAYVLWELARIAIDRHLLGASTGPKMPGAAEEEDDEGGPGSRLQTILPMLRIMIGGLIAVVATLVVLSRLGIDTGPLIAGAGVFGLAISFGSQSLVRDIISGLFYLWDDAFRIGEYIDTGRLKGTVEALGIRSVKVRHQNGPLHTIPYGQLGAVTNMSRDFATIKFNLQLEPGTDLELVRRAAKKIGIAMQDEPQIAAEVMLPLKMQGIAEITNTAVVCRFKFTARPVKPSWVQREYLKRMYQVFAEQGINFATGTLTLQTVPPRDATAVHEVIPVAAQTAEVLPLPLRAAEEAAAAAVVVRPAIAQAQPAE
jgi:moderate conductance mechanosensitive channel